MKERFMKNGVFSLEYDKETLKDMVLEKQEEIEILKENAKNNDKVVDNVNWENQLLKKENQELKKQLENNLKINVADHKYASTCEDKVIILETQKKEFIKWLEDEIQKKREKTATLTSFIRNVVPLKQCLQKYKSIIGDKDE